MPKKGTVIRTLERLYLKKIIVYPRTESDYISNSELMSYDPHPKLTVANEFCEPLAKKKYPFDFNSMYLHFHNIRALTPANYKRNKAKIDKIIKTTEKKDIEILVNSYLNFIEANRKESARYFIDSQLEHFRKPEHNEIKLDRYKTFNDLIEDNQQKHENSSNIDNSYCQFKENSL